MDCKVHHRNAVRRRTPAGSAAAHVPFIRIEHLQPIRALFAHIIIYIHVLGWTPKCDKHQFNFRT